MRNKKGTKHCRKCGDELILEDERYRYLCHWCNAKENMAGGFYILCVIGLIILGLALI